MGLGLDKEGWEAGMEGMGVRWLFDRVWMGGVGSMGGFGSIFFLSSCKLITKLYCPLGNRFNPCSPFTLV